MANPNDNMLEPFDLVIFGGTGDLTMRKLLPAMYFRHREGQLPQQGRVICVARSNYTTASFIEHISNKVPEYISGAEYDHADWQAFCQQVEYIPLDINEQSQYQGLAKLLNANPDRVRVFYLSTAPALFVRICEGVADADLISARSRVALEKPLGRDAASAIEINDKLAQFFSEKQIYRIDHYLGKETVQNLMALRFGNALFEPLWRRELISDVQITLTEDIGVEGRAGFYDQTGALRDMVQNHILQLLVILAMEPPVSMDPDAIRDEKIKVLRSLKIIEGKDVEKYTVRGQYKAGVSDGERVPGYLQSDDVPDDSITETFVAIRAEIESWRWQGVPFFLRTGKRLSERRTEIVINFKQAPHSIFDKSSQPNRLTITLQPEESIKLSIFAKGRGDDMRLQSVDLDLDFNKIFKKRQMIAYERLLLDMIRGNQTLFNHRDEVTAAWAWIDPIIAGWQNYALAPQQYAAGSWGPAGASALIARDGYSWFEEGV